MQRSWTKVRRLRRLHGEDEAIDDVRIKNVPINDMHPTHKHNTQSIHRRTPGRLEERLDALLHVKWTVKEFECDLTREIVQLIDREANLLNR